MKHVMAVLILILGPTIGLSQGFVNYITYYGAFAKWDSMSLAGHRYPLAPSRVTSVLSGESVVFRWVTGQGELWSPFRLGNTTNSTKTYKWITEYAWFSSDYQQNEIPVGTNFTYLAGPRAGSTAYYEWYPNAGLDSVIVQVVKTDTFYLHLRAPTYGHGPIDRWDACPIRAFECPPAKRPLSEEEAGAMGDLKRIVTAAWRYGSQTPVWTDTTRCDGFHLFDFSTAGPPSYGLNTYLVQLGFAQNGARDIVTPNGYFSVYAWDAHHIEIVGKPFSFVEPSTGFCAKYAVYRDSISAPKFWNGTYFEDDGFFLPPVHPQLLAPADFATGLPQPVILQWAPSPGALTYRLQISRTNFATMVFDDSSLTQTAKSVYLPAGATYKWRVNAKGPGGTSSWGYVGTFTTAQADAGWTLCWSHPSAATAITPAGEYHGKILGKSSSGAFSSTDLGSTWTAIGLSGENIVGYAVVADTIFAASANMKVYRSTNLGADWSLTTNGLADPTSIKCITGDGGNVFVGTGQSLYVLAPGTDSWRDLKRNLGVESIGIRWPRIVTGTFGVLISDDYGETWRTVPFIGSTPNYICHRDGHLLMSTAGYAGLTSPGIYRSTDEGFNWPRTSYQDSPIESREQISFLSAGAYIFAGVSSIRLYGSPDDGVSWVQVSPPPGLNFHTPVYASDTYLYVQGLKISQDSTQLWRRALSDFDILLPIQLSSFSCTSTALGVKLDWKTVSEVNNYGFFVERKTGAEAVFHELPDSFIPGHGTTSVVNTYSYLDKNPPGVESTYRLRQVDLDGTVHYSEPVGADRVASVATDGPASFALSQNYPNPFNPTTTIRYGLPYRSHVTLTVFNTLGQQVSILQNGEQDAGYHEVQFDATLLPSGIYFYRMQAGDFTLTRKSHLVR